MSRLLRFEGGIAAGGAGDSQKNAPRPGEPLNDADPENDGDCATVDLRWSGAGESRSMASLRDELAE